MSTGKVVRALPEFVPTRRGMTESGVLWRSLFLTGPFWFESGLPDELLQAGAWRRCRSLIRLLMSKGRFERAEAVARKFCEKRGLRP